MPSLNVFALARRWEYRGEAHPEELLLELTAGALDAGFRRRYILHYQIGSDGARRIDPVALQPQDFVHEWMIRSWEEMRPRSSGTLATWHALLHTDDVSGEYRFVQPCADRAGVTQVAAEIVRTGNRGVREPLTVYFLVQDNGEHRYKMSEISLARQPGCPGEAYATYDSPPSLFKDK